MNFMNRLSKEDKLLKSRLLKKSDLVISSSFEDRLTHRLQMSSRPNVAVSFGDALALSYSLHAKKIILLISMLIFLALFVQMQFVSLRQTDDLFKVDTLSMISLSAM